MPRQMFNSFWYGPELSPLEWACLNSFLDRGHGFRLFCYDVIDVPTGVLLADASRIVPKEELFLVDGNVAAFSDLFRYKVLQTYSEWWSDTDVYCLREDIPDCDYAWAEEDPDGINGAILRFPPNDPTLSTISRAAHAIGTNSKIWCELGPHLLTKHLGGRTFPGHFGSRTYFYPIHWLEAFLFWLPGKANCVKSRSEDSYFIHFWNSVLGMMGIDRYSRPPRGSFLEGIYATGTRRFSAHKPDVSNHRHTIASILAFINAEWVPECSTRKLGYDISQYPFDDLDL
jgi:hypothetical protein